MGLAQTVAITPQGHAAPVATTAFDATVMSFYSSHSLIEAVFQMPQNAQRASRCVCRYARSTLLARHKTAAALIVLFLCSPAPLCCLVCLITSWWWFA
ncbi:hypothetical protein LSM04_009643 [Trypanosoma melophagium]|uniref:uncharacterized protein n=1 Tax=Trypanosoma melophagium TaxID=715481 RepID=UPI003519D999|nr:hypothetical protein LSM04_009643 [Trypanosoma melophagium]